MLELSIEIGQLIRKKRKEKKITQEALALQCGIDRSYIGRIERGEVNLTVEKLYEIATALEVDMKEIIAIIFSVFFQYHILQIQSDHQFS
nr:RtrR protein [Acinetobacter sp.]